MDQNFIRNVAIEINEMLVGLFFSKHSYSGIFSQEFQRAPVTNSSYLRIKNGVKSFIEVISQLLMTDVAILYKKDKKDAILIGIKGVSRAGIFWSCNNLFKSLTQVHIFLYTVKTSLFIFSMSFDFT